MKKSILILLLVAIAWQLKAMDPLSDDMKKWYEDLGIDIKDLPKNPSDRKKEKEDRWNLVRAAYKKQSLRYHPDRNPGNKAAEEKFKEVGESYKKLETQLTEQKIQTLAEQMKEARTNSEKLIKQGDDEDQPRAAFLFYSEALAPFISTNQAYGFDIIGQTCYKTIEKYYKKFDYLNVIFHAEPNLEFINNIIKDYQGLVRFGAIASYNLIDAGYDAKKAYADMLGNFADLKKITKSAYTELKKIVPSLWEKIRQDLNSGDIIRISKAMNKELGKYMKDYKIDDVIITPILDLDQRNEFMRGFFKLADAYLRVDNAAEAIKILEKGLRINNAFKNANLISLDLKNEFENRLNLLKTQQNKNLLEAFKQLSRSFSDLKGKLTIS